MASKGSIPTPTFTSFISFTPITVPTSTTTFTYIPTSTPTPSPTSASTLRPKNEIEKSLSVFMQNYIVENEILPLLDIFKSENIPGLSGPPESFIIVSSPIIKDYQSSDPFQWLDTNNAYEVWLYENNQLIVQKNAQSVITNYQQKYMKIDQSKPSIFTWGYHEFGIVSISDDQRTAEIYLSVTCGSACGHGILFTLKQDNNGEWTINDLQGLWGS
jgi:hypothetical protein